MRILCLNLKKPQDSSTAEAFLALSPLVQFRYPHYVFIDIASTSMMFGGERKTLEKALQIAAVFSKEVTAAVADSAPVAQMLALWKPSHITVTGSDSAAFQGLGLDAVKELEGLQPWTKARQLEHVIAFCHGLGILTLEDLFKFRMSSLRERWGDFGVTIWNRLHNQDFQILSPLISADPLVGYGYLDDPISLESFLFNHIQIQLNRLWARLEGKGRFAQKMEFILHCEYSDHQHQFQIEPVSPSRDLKLFEDLLRQKLATLELQNPIREFEITIVDVPEKIQQLDFFEPRDSTEDRWRKLLSLAQQGQCEMGFLQIQDHHFPEKSFAFSKDYPVEMIHEEIARQNDQALQVKSAYAKNLNRSPRPSLLLEQPQALSYDELQKIKFVSRLPSERIEANWWDFSEKDFKQRDYFFALSGQGQLLWVFQDRLSEKFYLHGYFD